MGDNLVLDMEAVLEEFSDKMEELVDLIGGHQREVSDMKREIVNQKEKLKESVMIQEMLYIWTLDVQRKQQEFQNYREECLQHQVPQQMCCQSILTRQETEQIMRREIEAVSIAVELREMSKKMAVRGLEMAVESREINKSVKDMSKKFQKMRLKVTKAVKDGVDLHKMREGVPMGALAAEDYQKLMVWRFASDCRMKTDWSKEVDPQEYVEKRINGDTEGLMSLVLKMRFNMLQKIWKAVEFEKRMMVVFRGQVTIRFELEDGQSQEIKKILFVEQNNGKIVVRTLEMAKDKQIPEIVIPEDKVMKADVVE